MSKKKKLIKLIDTIVIILLFILGQSMTLFIIKYIQGKTLPGLYIEDVFFWYGVHGLERIVFDFF